MEEQLESANSEILLDYPLAAGLTSVSDVINQLPYPTPYPPSFFPPPSSSTPLAALQSPTAMPMPQHDPAFAQYSNEIALLCSASAGTAEEEAWKRAQLDRAAREIREEATVFSHPSASSSSSWGGLSFGQPPHVKYAHFGQPQPNSQPSQTSAAAHLLSALHIPSPPPSSTPTPTNSEPTDSLPPQAFFQQFLTTKKNERLAALQPPPPPPLRPNLTTSSSASSIFSRPASPSKPPPQLPPSSPDPLRLSPSTIKTPTQKRPALHFEIQVPAATKEMRKSLSRSPTLPFASGSGLNGSGKKRTDSERERIGESPTKKWKLDEGVPSSGGAGVNGVNGSGTSGRGKVRTSATPGGNDIVDSFSDYLSDLLLEDDSFAQDTSTTSSPPPQPTYFHPPTSSAHHPILLSSTLQKLLKQLLRVKANGKEEALVKEMTKEGLEVARFLSIVERSWKDADNESVWWTKEMSAKKKEGMDDDEDGGGKKGKGKAKATPNGTKSKGGRSKKEKSSSASPMKERRSTRSRSRSKSRGTSAVDGEDVEMNYAENQQQDLEDDDDDLEDPMDGTTSNANSPWTDDHLDSFTSRLETLQHQLLSIRVSLLLLEVLQLPSSTSEFWTSLLTLLRSTLDNLLLPLSDPSQTSGTWLTSLFSDLAARKELENARNELCESLTGLASFISLSQKAQGRGGIGWGEELALKGFYLAITCCSALNLTAAPGSVKGKLAGIYVKGVGENGLRLMKFLLGNWGDMRTWVVDELLAGVLGGVGGGAGGGGKGKKGGFRLRTGGTIHGFSAVAMIVVQSLSSGLGPDVRRRIEEQAKGVEGGEDGDEKKAPKTNGKSKSPLKRKKRVIQDDDDDEDEEESDEEDVEMSEVDESEQDGLTIASRHIVEPALDGAMKAAFKIVKFLLQKSCKAGKMTSGSTEAEYRIVLDNLVADLLTTLHLPEWPAAELLLTACCRSMMATLVESTKTTHDMNALKNVSLDHLGPIGARIRAEASKALKPKEALRTLHEILASSDIDGLETLFDAEKDVLKHLYRQDGHASSEGAAELTRALLARDLLQASSAAQSIANKFSEEELEEDEGLRGQKVALRLKVMARDIWDLDELEEEDVFGPNIDEERVRIDSLVSQLSRNQPLASVYDPLLKQILEASESTAVSFRTKALKGISLIVAQDEELFLQEDVRRTIQNRILDSSPAVRDAALELVGKYVVNRPDLAVEYLPLISERITDTGLGVRRRVVKLLKALFYVVEQDEFRIDICRKLVGRALDEDDGIKELAIDAVEDLWFSKTLPSSKSRAPVTEDSQTSEIGAKSGISQLASIIMAVTSVYKGQPPPVDAVLRHIIQKHVSKDTKPPLGRLKDVTESLIDGLVENVDSLNVTDCIKTIYILNSAEPSLLSTAKATLLLPFLKSSNTPADQLISEYLLKIFRSTVATLPKGTQKFARDLQVALLPMINKPAPSSTPSSLQEIVACFCAVIRGQTHDFAKLIATFKACAGRLFQETKKLLDPATAKDAQIRSIPMLSFLTSLLTESGNFDKIRSEYPETKAEIDAIIPTNVTDFVFGMLLKLHSCAAAGPAIHSAAMISLGFLYRAYPTLLLKPQSTTILDAVFASTQLSARLQLLRILQDFLASQDRTEAAVASAKAKKGKDEKVNIEELVGNVEGFADSGVASAISQRYIEPIIDSALSTNSAVQRVGVDILTAIARSGFGHPLTIAPPLIALCGCTDSQLASKAYATLSVLHQKHGSLLATRYLVSVKTVHRYAEGVAGDQEVKGYFGDESLSYLNRWYGLLKEKRQYQLEFLKSLSRVFEVDLSLPCYESDLAFARFVAEAISTLDFKRNEEPMLVLHHLSNALAVSGLQVLHALEEGLEGGGGLMAGIQNTAAPVSPLKRTGSASPAKFSSPVKPEVSASQSLSTPAPTPTPGVEEGPPSASLARQSVIAGLALLLRDHLKLLYSISDMKLGAFKPGKKSAFGDKTATRRAGAPEALGLDSYERLPLALRKDLDTPDLLIQQRATYIALIQTDGTIGALEELDAAAADED